MLHWRSDSDQILHQLILRLCKYDIAGYHGKSLLTGIMCQLGGWFND